MWLIVAHIGYWMLWWSEIVQVITSIGDDERFYAKGVYHYRLGDNDTHIREPWTIHEQADGTFITRVERDATVFKANLLVEIRSKQSQISNIGIRWTNENEHMVSEATASYEFSEHNLTITRKCEGKQFTENHTLESGVVVSPLMRIGMGAVLTKLVNYPDGTQVLIPNIKEPDNPDVLLSAYFEERKATVLSTETITAGGVVYQAKRYQYIGELYDESAQFWVDEYGVLLRYTWQQPDGKQWQIDLHDYVRA